MPLSERDDLARIAALERQAASAERNLTDHARQHTAFTEELRRHGDLLASITTDRAVRTERDANLNGRLDRIEKSLGSVHALGRWVLAAFGFAFISGIVGLFFSGVFQVGP